MLYDLAVSIDFGTQFEATLDPNNPPSGPLWEHSAQYLARAVAQRGHFGCPGVSLGAQSGQSAVGFA